MSSTDIHTRGPSPGSGQRLAFAQRAYRPMQDAHIHSPSSKMPPSMSELIAPAAHQRRAVLPLMGVGPLNETARGSR